MEKNNLKCVIFDLDGVITDTAKYHYLAWKQLAEDFNFYFSEEINEELKGISRKESLDIILKYNNKLLDYSDSEKEELCNKKNEIYVKLLKENLTTNNILPGIKEFLAELKDNNIKVALASVSKNAKLILKKLNIFDIFDYIADPTKVKNLKPNPDIFLDCINHFGFNELSYIAIEDSEAGIEAINSAGIKSIGVGEKSRMQYANLVCDTKNLSLEFILNSL